jgi:hypothetical protein
MAERNQARLGSAFVRHNYNEVKKAGEGNRPRTTACPIHPVPQEPIRKRPKVARTIDAGEESPCCGGSRRTVLTSANPDSRIIDDATRDPKSRTRPRRIHYSSAGLVQPRATLDNIDLVVRASLPTGNEGGRISFTTPVSRVDISVSEATISCLCCGFVRVGSRVMLEWRRDSMLAFHRCNFPAFIAPAPTF